MAASAAASTRPKETARTRERAGGDRDDAGGERVHAVDQVHEVGEAGDPEDGQRVGGPAEVEVADHRQVDGGRRRRSPTTGISAISTIPQQLHDRDSGPGCRPRRPSSRDQAVPIEDARDRARRRSTNSAAGTRIPTTIASPPMRGTGLRVHSRPVASCRRCRRSCGAPARRRSASARGRSPTAQEEAPRADSPRQARAGSPGRTWPRCL